MKNTELFSNKVENYVRYRPHYPKEIIPFLRSKVGLTDRSIIADIGSGTGISSEIFLENGNTVYAIEPNKEMRVAAEEIHKKDKTFISVNATAEKTSLPEHSVDLIIAGQAFHWFDKVQAKKEFQRILTSNGYLVLIWNDRKEESHFQQAYEQMLIEFIPDHEKINYSKVSEHTVETLFSPNSYFHQSFPNSQSFTFEGLKGRLLSSSFAPSEHEKNFKPMMSRLEKIFKEFNINGQIEFEYICNLYCGKIQ